MLLNWRTSISKFSTKSNVQKQQQNKKIKLGSAQQGKSLSLYFSFWSSLYFIFNQFYEGEKLFVFFFFRDSFNWLDSSSVYELFNFMHPRIQGEKIRDFSWINYLGLNFEFNLILPDSIPVPNFTLVYGQSFRFNFGKTEYNLDYNLIQVYRCFCHGKRLK